MNRNISEFIVIFLFGIISGMLIVGLFTINSYKNGQIDCINGVIKYELVVHPDKTSSWELIKR